MKCSAGFRLAPSSVVLQRNQLAGLKDVCPAISKIPKKYFFLGFFDFAQNLRECSWGPDTSFLRFLEWSEILNFPYETSIFWEIFVIAGHPSFKSTGQLKDQNHCPPEAGAISKNLSKPLMQESEIAAQTLRNLSWTVLETMGTCFVVKIQSTTKISMLILLPRQWNFPIWADFDSLCSDSVSQAGKIHVSKVLKLKNAK